MYFYSTFSYINIRLHRPASLATPTISLTHAGGLNCNLYMGNRTIFPPSHCFSSLLAIVFQRMLASVRRWFHCWFQKYIMSLAFHISSYVCVYFGSGFGTWSRVGVTVTRTRNWLDSNYLNKVLIAHARQRVCVWEREREATKRIITSCSFFSMLPFPSFHFHIRENKIPHYHHPIIPSYSNPSPHPYHRRLTRLGPNYTNRTVPKRKGPPV